MKKLLKGILIVITAVSVLMSFAIIFTWRYLSKYKDVNVDETLLDISEISTQTSFYSYDFTNRQSRMGKAVLIEDARIDCGVKYKYVPYSEIPKDLINAFVAIEDKRFFKHDGVDFLRSSKAALNYMLKGRSEFGGSTLTQQLVKNLTGEDDISSRRKIKEVFSAINLEKKYDKSEILEMYLNIINLSDGCRGIGAATEHFYSKEPKDLSLSECATIAAITNNPTKYNPRTHPENVIRRRNIVLKCMYDDQYISEAEYLSAKNEEITLDLSHNVNDTVSSWYTDMVIEDIISDLSDKYGITKEYASFLLYRGGYKIYTAMDQSVQKILDEYYTNLANFPADANGDFPQSAMIILDPYTGDILGVAGAIGEKNANRIQNYATQAKRPPGSSIKPLSVYAPAFESGEIIWSSIIEDSPVTEASSKNKPWPSNANGKYIGNVTVRYAVENSLNTVAVKLLDKIGAENSFDFLKNKLNIASLDEKNDMGLASLALGQPSRGITLRELVGAYTIFEEGIMSRPRSYFKVTDQNGRIILDNTLNQSKVISRENAAIMTKLMETVVDSGTAKGLISLDKNVSVAGKTGTTQGNRDRFFVGYTPDLLGGTWFGYEYPESLDFFGGNYAAVFWNEVMTRIYEETDYCKGKKLFTVPNTVQKLTFNKKTGESPSANDNLDLLEDGWFIKSEYHISQ